MMNFCMRSDQLPSRSHQVEYHSRFEDHVLKILRNGCENIKIKIIQKEKNKQIHFMEQYYHIGK